MSLVVVVTNPVKPTRLTRFYVSGGRTPEESSREAAWALGNRANGGACQDRLGDKDTGLAGRGAYYVVTEVPEGGHFGHFPFRHLLFHESTVFTQRRRSGRWHCTSANPNPSAIGADGAAQDHPIAGCSAGLTVYRGEYYTRDRIRDRFLLRWAALQA